ncbi:hypothetical protein TBR22_A03990 [Luteitalea sp. TBR-22]|uniref:serine/threonine-protein kinase n=1 Tax=Luteitalea sp. TBR-22 TaxID=2802971 RepID=UPI001AF60ECF|nr:serine/threonine-protein kinase [Luteitalea sp. TBR-22]BCS31199.1 hypothetical protein TBR22_A03990 [Luteitalea sp. TBR-22]
MSADDSLTPEAWGDIKELLAELGTLSPGEREARLQSLPADRVARLQPFLDVDTGVVVPPATPGVPPTQAEEILAGRYRIERPLGRGGMGTVDLAHDLTLDCPVAIKRLSNLWLPDAEARRRLVREARALAALNHPHVARVHDVIDSSPPALVMEYVEGETLVDWLELPRAARTVIGVLRQVVEAVAYAHTRGVIHCDLKPGNVLVTPDDRAKVVDFGIAQMQRTASTTRVGDTTVAPAFTPRYAAPEVKQGARPVPASDVYSLGVLVDEVVDECAKAGAPLPPPLAQALRRASQAACVTEADRRPRDGAAFLAMLPTVAAPDAAAGWRTRAASAVLVLSGCISGGLAVTGDGSALRPASLGGGKPIVVAVVPRVDDASASTISAAAADFLRRSLGTLTRARLVTADVPAFKDDVDTLVKDLRFEGLTYVFVPSVAPTATGVRVSVAVRRAAGGGVVQTFTEEGPSSALGAITGRLASQVRAWLNEPARPPGGPVYEPSARALGEYSQARQYLERPDKPEAFQLARELLERAVEREPEFAAAHAELSRVLVLQYRARRDAALLVQAQAAAGKAMRLDPGLVEARLAHATTLQATGQRADAISELQQILKVAPTHDRAMRLLGQLQAASGAMDDGVRTLREVIALHPSWQNYRALGTVLYDAGRYAEAEQEYRECVALQPDNPFAHQLLGAALQKQNRDAEAVREYERALAIQPSAPAYTNLGTYQYGLGDLKAAERAYRKAVEIAPQDPLMQRNLSDALRAQGRAREAREGYQRAAELAEAELRVNPQDQTAQSLAAYAWARAGNCELSNVPSTRIESAPSPSVDGLIDVVNARLICGVVPQALVDLRAIAAAGVSLSGVLERDVEEAAPRPVRQFVAGAASAGK